MSKEGNYFKHSKGAKLLEAYCYDYAECKTIKLKSVSWSVDIDKLVENKVLTIETSDGAKSIHFSKEEIENYPGRSGTERHKSKIEKAINTLG